MVISDTELQQLLTISYAIATRAYRNNDPEYLSEAHTAMLHAVKTYDASRNVPLRAWVSFIVRRHLQWFHRKQQPQLNFETALSIASQHNRVIDAIDDLSAADAAIARLYWIYNYTMSEICDGLNLHVVLLRLKIDRIRLELREALYGERSTHTTG
jgi:DNA-directed RNA polymerase specialized sigma24 family protein